MSSYPFEEYTRVAVVPVIADLPFPTLAELATGTDITCDLTRDGLVLPRKTEVIARARWTQLLSAEAPGHYSMNGALLRAKRRTQGDREPLWHAAVYRSAAFLVVRRGIPYATGWTTGQIVEAMAVRFGKRDVAPSASNAAVTFDVPLFVDDDEQEAVVT